MSKSVTSSQSRAAIFLARLSFIAWTFVLIWLINYTFQWTYPYCNSGGDGPARAAYGFPLPFLQDQFVPSFSADIMPHVLLLNVAVLAALAYPIMGWAVKWLSSAGWIVGVLIAVPGLLISIAMALAPFAIAFAFQGTDAVISISGYGGRYWDYRPVGIVFESDCHPSEFWFGPIKTENLATVPGR